MTTRTLVLLRHGKSAYPEGADDADRPLSARGERDAPAAGRWLRTHVPAIDAVVCSPALRALQTWRLVAAELAATPAFRFDPKIYAASVRDLLGVVRGLPADATTALLIGHNPGLSEFVGEVSGSAVELKTSGVAMLRGEGEWADVGWVLVESAKPRGVRL
ncbi:MAG TPA: histidine phosphatase family protein [Pseudonocardiaceae bacterium]|nr:histidine phosphatase family protein [Pseudonocardiaceae bacterium]